MRYPLRSTSSGGVASQPQSVLLEMWAYEACRLFRDRLVGQESQERFDTILSSVVRSDWSLDVSSLEKEGGAMYVTWGASQSQDKVTSLFGQSLGRLSSTDLQEIVAKGIVGYGEWETNHLISN